MLEDNWVSSGLKFLAGDYTRYRDPDDNSRVEEALGILEFPDIWPRFKQSVEAVRQTSDVKTLTPFYTGSYRGKYLLGLSFHTDNEDVVLGHCIPQPGIKIDISGQRPEKNSITLQSDNRGIFEVRTQNSGPPVMQLRNHEKIVLNPASLSSILGIWVEDNRMIMFGLLEHA
ncbi:MAG: hypothetical protein Q9201_000609 [Fulgogasparrea decipioides]